MVSPTPERLPKLSAFLMSQRFTDKRVMLNVHQWSDLPLSELLQACNMAADQGTGEWRTTAGRSAGVSIWLTRKKDW